MIIGASMGGWAVAHAAKKGWTDRSRPLYRYDQKDVGEVRIALRGSDDSVVLDTPRS